MKYTCTLTTTEENEKRIWDFLYRNIKNVYGVSGLMGNLFSESGLRPENLQNTFEKILGMTDAQYTDGVNNGTYTNFVHDSAGYGLAQWTFWSRKDALQKYAKDHRKLINDLDMQLEYLWIELNTKYKGTLNILLRATSVKEASDEVLLHFEHPGAVDDPNRVEKVKSDRLGYSMIFYNKFSGSTPAPTPESTPTGDYTYNNVDYSPVFDPKFYSDRYSDLKKAYGYDSTKLFNHFVEYGMAEARQANKDFNPSIYRAKYRDLEKAYGKNWLEYYKHYCVYGIKEGRTC